MAVTAITGDIGAGKSTAARILAERLGCPCVDADAVAKGLWLREDVKAEAVGRWGSEILDTSGSIILSRLSEHIFSSRTEHDYCDELIHPLVMSELEAVSLSLGDVVLEIPLLPEAGRPKWIDRAIYVTAEFTVRAERCRARGWSVEELRRREEFLLPQHERIAMCEVVIHNDGDIAVLTKELYASTT